MVQSRSHERVLQRLIFQVNDVDRDSDVEEIKCPEVLLFMEFEVPSG